MIELFDHKRTHGYSTIYKIILIVAIFVVLLVSMMGVIYITGNVSEGVRSYVRGEGLWAKAQKNAVQRLYTYTYTFDGREYAFFLEHMQVMEGDRGARLTLSLPEPDLQIAREGFLAGDNHPDDIEHLINFFLYFHNFYYMRQAIAIWEQADVKVAELKALGEDLHREINRAPLARTDLSELRARLELLDTQLQNKEIEFSLILSEGARWVRNVTLAASLFTIIVFTMIGVWVSTRVIRSVSRDLAEKNEMEAQIRRQAREDPLTGLSNRNELYERLAKHLKLARRENKMLALLFLDLDNFKPVNDTYGHAVGDALLQSVSSILIKHTRETDVVARFGGDEFVIVLVHPTGRQDIGATAERIISGINVPMNILDANLQIGASIGISVFPEDNENEEDLLRMADSALYLAKQAGRNTHRFYQPGDERSAEAH